MKKFLRLGLRRSVRLAVNLAKKTSLGRYVCNHVASSAMLRTREVQHKGVILRFVVPNSLNEFRVATFSTKEPETLDWIDGMPYGSVIWDIGANVGLYSCYAAKKQGCKVFSFEPSVFNLELLARNVFLNGLADKVTIVPLPLCGGLTTSTMNMTNTEWGGALSTFEQSYGFDGQPLQNEFEFSTIGLSMDQALDLLKIPQPDHIKIDVDGIEHLILKGGGRVLGRASSVLVEINDDFRQQADDSTCYLRAAGLQLKAKQRWRETDDTPFERTYNQIWRREDRL